GAAAQLATFVGGFMNIPGTGAGPFHPGRPLAASERDAWEKIRPALLRRRGQRTMPARDEKVVAAWNGQLLSALAGAAMVLDRADCLAAAVDLGGYLQDVHWDGHLSRVSHDGRARGIMGLLDDHAGCANGFLSLYAATGELRWFEFAGTLVGALEEDFIADGVVLGNAADRALAGSKYADPFDNASASGVALMGEAFTSWAAYTGSRHHRSLAEGLLASLPALARQAPRAAGGLLGVAEALAAGPQEVAIVGPPGPEREALLRCAWAATSPGLVIAVWDGLGAPPVPLMAGRSLGERTPAGRQGDAPVVPLAYVCQNMVCARPVATAAELHQLLS
ncbi:MAG: thioredoxin domain-containing protein, partial [Specibacter sp.]